MTCGWMKKTAIISMLSVVSSIAMAGGANNLSVQNEPDGAEGIGFSLAYNSMAASAFSVGVDYKLSLIEMGATLSAQINESVRSSVGNWNRYDLGGYVGYRFPLASGFFASGGFQVNYSIISNDANYNQGVGIDHNPYVLGPYVGFSYEPGMHVAIFCRVSPISYQSFGYLDNSALNGKENRWEFFNAGVIGMSYYIA